MQRLNTLILLFLFLKVSGQISSDVPSVFLDCQTNCFETYLRQEITFFDYVRDRQVSNVYVLVTAQSASAGAREIQLIFDYKEEASLNADTIRYIRPANISDAAERDLFVEHFKRGMLPVIVQSSLVNQLTYDIDIDEATIDEDLEYDPWNYWSFNTSLNLNINGEESFKENRYFARFSASRVTEKSKIVWSSWYNFNKSSFTLSDGEEVESENKRNSTFFQYVKSINQHWSIGFRSQAGSSSFGNTDFEATVKPAIEYNIFPYSESSTKRFSFLYSVGAFYKNYTELTIFEKLEETLVQQSLDLEYILTQQWGDISIDVRFDQYLHDLSLYSISFNPNVELNLFKGLRLEFGGFLSFVGDRINISKSEISAQDIILQNRQLDTSYSYFSYFGFNYRFGSQNNNIVNPRF